MEQAIVKIVVLMKNSYPQKYIIWSTYSQHPGLHYSRYFEDY